MAYSPAKIRIIGRTCMDEYDAAAMVYTIQEIVGAKNMSEENTKLVLDWIYTQRPELKPQEPPPEQPIEPDTPTES